ncbi:hypothetical protein DI09_100p20 [Mitosporidium daphniae]|uniref:Uncharacterized protein n=1 Tax=Mitosporidium daphniae TaxID=1485682 RepID=A0A098VVU7_9MICR|nr:uncharacterized protein DI09_100p20 [Mitosporidium daphniae]KGG53238.1 hypothetical protein DI09_100p20 [Mitosporidium daphniae]|eukprot:XP_013239674.1 uncharacterized protein DI09_100p20 [Mitosporidium daphniae]
MGIAIPVEQRIQDIRGNRNIGVKKLINFLPKSMISASSPDTLMEGVPEILSLSIEELSGIDPLHTRVEEIVNRTKLLENDLKVHGKFS